MLAKLKALYLNLKENVFLKYPVTICGIWVAAILMAVWVEYPFENGKETLDKLLAFVWIFNAGSLFTEEYFGKVRLRIRSIGFAVSACISFLFVFIGWYEGKKLLGIDMELIRDYLYRYLIVYLVWIAALCVYRMYKNSQVIFEKYCLSVFGSVMRTSIVYGLFALGIAAIISIFDTLICDTGELLFRLEVFLVCALYIPGVLLALSKVIEEAGKFLRLVVKYVLLILTMAAFAVIYIYICKILFAWELPSNEVFPILSWLFVCGLPIWTIAGYFKEEKLGRLAKLLPYAFIPFIILQGICIGLRVRQYGLTEERYICCFLILAEIFYFILYAPKRQRLLPYIFYVAAGLFTIYLLAPVVKFDSAVFLSQKGRFEAYMKKAEQGTELSTEEIKLALDAYGAMNCVRPGEKYVDNLPAEWKALVEDYKDMDLTHASGVYEKRYIYASWRVEDGMDIGGYQKIYKIYAGDGGYGSNAKAIDLTKIELSLSDKKTEVDLTDFAKRLTEEYEKNDNRSYDNEALDLWLREEGKIPLENGELLYLNSVSMDFRDDDCTDFRIEGYVLEK